MLLRLPPCGWQRRQRLLLQRRLGYLDSKRRASEQGLTISNG